MMRSAYPPAPHISPVGWCVIVSLLLCVFEGAARKWVLPNSTPAVQALMYFSKDVPLLLAALIALTNPRRLFSDMFDPLLQLLIFGSGLVIVGSVIALQGFNPMGAVISIRNGLALPWIAWLIGRNLLGTRDILAICHVSGFCAIFNAGLGAMQFFLPAENVLNQQTTDFVTSVESVGRTRANGTFSFLAGMADLCLLATWAGCTFLGHRPRNPFGYAYVIAGLTCSAVAMSRGGLLMSVAIISLVLICTARLRVIGIVILIICVVMNLFRSNTFDAMDEDDPGIHTAVLKRHEGAGDDILERATGGFASDFYYALSNVPFGVGLGQGQTGGQAKTAESDLLLQAIYEGEPGRIVYETGFLGFLGFYAIRLGVPIIFWRYKPKVVPPSIAMGDAIWWPTIWFTGFGFNMLIVFNHFQATFQAIAMICLLGAAEQIARRKSQRGT